MYIFNAPDWFIGYDIFFELAFAFITLFVSWHAFKVYKITSQGRSRLFGIAFAFISLSYFLQSFLNYSILSQINQNICSALKLNNLVLLNEIQSYIHITFFLIGLLILAYMTFRVRSKAAFALMLALTFIPLFITATSQFLYYITSSVLLAFIVFYYITNYIRHRQTNTLLPLAAFVFLLFGSIHYLLSVNHATFYAISHMLELIAYVLILIDLILVVKK